MTTDELIAKVDKRHREHKNWPLVKGDQRVWLSDGYIHECGRCGEEWPCPEAQLVAALKAGAA